MKRKPVDLVQTQVARYREISPKKKLKRKAKSFVENTARLCFGFRYKAIIIRNRPRKAELVYKIRVVGKNSSELLARFNKEMFAKVGTQYRLKFSGYFNPKTMHEEMFIELIIFGDIIKDQLNPAEG